MTTKLIVKRIIHEILEELRSRKGFELLDSLSSEDKETYKEMIGTLQSKVEAILKENQNDT